MKTAQNKQKDVLSEKKSRNTLKITIILIALLMIGDIWSELPLGLATETPSGKEVIKVEGNKVVVDEVTAAKCLNDLTAYAEPEFENYKTFMEGHFKNKSNTSSLMETAIQRYDQFKLNIMQKYQQLIGGQLILAINSGASNTLQGDKLKDCEQLALKYIDDASKLLQMRASATSNVKKTSIFVEKYKQINNKLGSLDMEIMKMVTNISSFEQKLPCYLKTCVK
jgi:hypothetical protein